MEPAQARWGIFERSDCGFVISDPDGTMVAMSAAYASMHGYSIAELVGKPIGVLLTPEWREKVPQLVREAHETGHLALELVHTRKDGTTFPVQADVVAARDGDGQVLYRAVWAQDITERDRAEETLQESAEKYRILCELASDAFLTTLASNGRIIDANSAAAALLGYSREELLGLSGPEHIIAPEVLAATERELQTQLEQQGHFQVETVWVRQDSTRVPVAVSGTALEIRGQLQFQLIGRDITERKWLEEALQRARKTLEGDVAREMLQDNPYRLTFREFTILHLVAAGKADKAIASELSISPLTVHKHVANIRAKMKAASRTEVGVRALREGWLD